ncbi:MAG: endonuclease NucS domain-containing protein [Paracoccaceae bacterium]
MDEGFRNWAAQGLSSNSLNSYLSGLRSLETAYGDLDAAYSTDCFAAVFKDLTYTATDDRAGRPNPSRVPIQRNLMKQLSNLRSHLRFYESYKEGAGNGLIDAAESPVMNDLDQSDGTDPPALSLERDLERALRADIGQIETGLQIIDGGVQTTVASGRIDILARDARQRRVVIELKAVRAPRDAVAQVLAYMGDISGETDADVRGMLIAPDFDPKALSAARMVPSLELKRFTFKFSFEPVGKPE